MFITTEEDHKLNLKVRATLADLGNDIERLKQRGFDWKAMDEAELALVIWPLVGQRDIAGLIAAQLTESSGSRSGSRVAIA